MRKEENTESPGKADFCGNTDFCGESAGPENQRLQSLFWQVYKSYTGKCYRQLMDLHVHPGQIPILIMLSDQSEMSQKEIADHLCIKPPTVNVMVRRMETAGLIARKTDAKDQRITRIFLTDRGLGMREMVKNIMRENEKYLFHGFDETEKILFKRFLRQTLDNIEKIPEHPAENL